MRSSARCCKFLIWTQRPGRVGMVWSPELAVAHKHRHPESDLPTPRGGQSLSPREVQPPPLYKRPCSGCAE